MEKVVLVDGNDVEVGVEEKLKAHLDGGRLHRAVSVFVFNSRGELLLQKRGSFTYHSPSSWSNTCCTHPREGESPEAAAHRRLREEMGFNCKLKKVLEFVYKADVGGGLTEHEFDHVFVGTFDGEPKPARGEVIDFMWADLKELQERMEEKPGHYTPWFRILLPKLLEVTE